MENTKDGVVYSTDAEISGKETHNTKINPADLKSGKASLIKDVKSNTKK